MAPSADNLAPYVIETCAREIHLRQIDEPSPHRRVLSAMSCGAAVENMCLRAAEAGLTTRVTWAFPRSLAHAQLTFRPAIGERNARLAGAIASRHTNRALFRGPGPSASQLETMARDTSRLACLWHPRNAQEHRHLARLIGHAEATRFSNPKFLEEIEGAVRWDAGWSASVERGIPLATLNIPSPLRSLFPLMCGWPWMRWARCVGMAHAVGLMAGTIPCRLAPTLLVFSTEQSVEVGAVDVGRAMQRAWLHLHSRDFAVHPMPAAALLAFTESFASERVRRGLLAEWRSLPIRGTPLMILRVGRAAPPRVRAGRPPLDQWLREKRSSGCFSKGEDDVFL